MTSAPPPSMCAPTWACSTASGAVKAEMSSPSCKRSTTCPSLRRWRCWRRRPGSPSTTKRAGRACAPRSRASASASWTPTASPKSSTSSSWPPPRHTRAARSSPSVASPRRCARILGSAMPRPRGIPSPATCVPRASRTRRSRFRAWGRRETAACTTVSVGASCGRSAILRARRWVSARVDWMTATRNRPSTSTPPRRRSIRSRSSCTVWTLRRRRSRPNIRSSSSRATRMSWPRTSRA